MNKNVLKKTSYCIKITLLAIFLISNIFAKSEFLTTDEIKEGMKGYGLTVFKGNKIEKFNVEILGVLKNTRPKGDIIIAKLSGGPLAQTGVIAGMSGSPVYISNKLIGAVAFSWTFSKEPIAGITPINDMLSLFDYSKPTNKFINPIFKENEKSSIKNIENLNNQNFSLSRLAIPLVFSGIDKRLLNVIDLKFSDSDFLPVLGGSDNDYFDSNITNNFEPGSPIAIRLVTGDLNISGVGTVTYKKGDKLLIFGHPMFYRGYCTYPIAPAKILTVFPGYQLSFKIATAGPIIGTTIQDRQYAVSCKIGPEPEMLPISINQYYKNKKNEFNYNIIDDYLYTQRFLSICLANTILHDKAPLEKNSFYIEMNINLDDGNNIKLGNLYSELTTTANVYDAMYDFSLPIRQLILNQFKQVKIKRIDIDIKQSDYIHIAEIQNLKLLSKKEIYTGDIINFEVTLKPHQQKAITTNISLKLPQNIRPGKLIIFASSAKEEKLTDIFFATARFKPESYEQLLKFLKEQDKNNELVIWGITKAPGLYIKGEKFPNLPESKFAIFNNSKDDSQSMMIVKFKKKITTPYVLYNFKKLQINIKKNKFGSYK